MSTALVTLTGKRGPAPKYATVAEAIEAGSIPIPFSGCWIWLGATAKGYGQLNHAGKHMTAHRASYIAHHPDEPPPKLVCHTCDVRECVNPAHLYAGDYITNRADMLERKRWKHPWATRTHCTAGHEYEVAGVSVAGDGTRVCKECQRTNKRNQRSRS